jgi:4-aminobutyrate--pyruvate transaminase
VAPRFSERVRRLAGKQLVGDARSVGLIGAIEIVADKSTKAQHDPQLKAAQQVVNRCLDHGLILRALPGDVVGICPPLIISSGEIDEMFDRLERALDDAVAQVPMAA